MMHFDEQTRQDVFEYLLRLGDNNLVLGHRLSEWCGHGPVLEEDIALSNTALDCVGQAVSFLALAGEVEGKGRDEDALAYFRDALEFRNLLLVEYPNVDFAYTIVRQFLFDVYAFYLLDALQHSAFDKLAALAAKSLKEVRYHLRHSREWVLRLGDGTAESHRRSLEALEELWMFTGDMFDGDEVDDRLLKHAIAVDMQHIYTQWQLAVQQTLQEATLPVPEVDNRIITGSRHGIHTEYLGHLLAELQIVPRSYPGAKW